MTRTCLVCGKLLVLIMGELLPKYCWDHMPDLSEAAAEKLRGAPKVGKSEELWLGRMSADYSKIESK